MAKVTKKGKQIHIKFETPQESAKFLRTAGFTHIPEAVDQRDEQRIAEAKQICIDVGYASVVLLQRQMRIGYMTAGHIIDQLIAEGFCTSEFETGTGRHQLIEQKAGDHV